MPTTLTDTPEASGAVSVPASGDARTASSVLTPFQKLADRTAYAIAAVDGLIVWTRRARVATGGAASGNTGIWVPPIEALVLSDGAAWKPFSLAAETQLTTGSHFASGTLAADTFYYVYAKVAASALTFELSVTAPDAGLVWKTGTTGTHRFLFCIRTDSSGVPLPMRMYHGRYLYRASAITATELRCLNTSTAVALTDVILARASGGTTGVAGLELIPPHARVAQVRAGLVVSGNAADDQVTVALVTKGDTTANTVRIDLYAPAASIAGERDAWVETDDARTLRYSLAFAAADASNPTATLQLFVHGFEE